MTSTLTCFPLLRRLLPAPLLLATLTARAQGVGIGTATPATSAALEVASTTQGLLLPRLTSAQRQAIASPAQGLQVFQTDGALGIYRYTGIVWVNVTTGRVPDATGSTLPANGGVVSTFVSSGQPGGMGACWLAAARRAMPTAQARPPASTTPPA